jgi:hypothetical protein
MLVHHCRDPDRDTCVYPGSNLLLHSGRVLDSDTGSIGCAVLVGSPLPDVLSSSGLGLATPLASPEPSATS